MSSIPIEPSEVEKRNSFDLETLDKTLNEIKGRAYWNLYQYQRELTGFVRYDFNINALRERRTTDDGRDHIHYEYAVDYTFVRPNERMRYKRSNLYRKELDFQMVQENSRIFNRTFIVFINGKFIDYVKVRPDESKTSIIIDLARGSYRGLNEKTLRNLQASNARVTVLFMPNNSFGAYETTASVLNAHKNNLNPVIPGIEKHVKDENSYIAFIDQYPSLFFIAGISSVKLSSKLLKFNPELDKDGSKPVHLNLFGFSHLHEVRLIQAEDTFFRLDGLDMPTPTENILLFKQDEHGHLVFAHTLSLKQYYPNVYEIIGKKTNETVVAFVFYSEDVPSNKNKYVDDLRLYTLLMNVTPQSYQSGNILPIVKEYTVGEVNYNHPDYSSSIYNDKHLSYKLNKLQELTDMNPKFFADYLRNQVEMVDSFYIDMRKIDYDGKLCNDNSTISGVKIPLTTFAEERVRIIVKNEKGTGTAFRFYINGEFYTPTDSWQRGIYKYFYIPSSILTRTSILEIEQFDVFIFKRGFTPTVLNEYVEVKFKKDLHFYANDVFVVDTETGRYLEVGRDYKLSLPHTDVDHFPLPDDSFREIDTGSFLVQFTSEYYLNRPVTIYAGRSEELKTYQITTDTAMNETFTLFPKTFPDKRHFRLFRNGRLIPQDLYSFYSANSMSQGIKINPSILKLKGDVFTLDYVPHRYKVVYSAKQIPKDGLVELKGLITKPLGLKWFDIYLNGRRLTKDQVFISSPTMMTIYNVDSLNNLLIVERDRDEEIVNMTPDNLTVIDKLVSLDPEFRLKLTTSIVLDDNTVVSVDPIEDTEVDIITEIIDVGDLELQDLVDRLIRRIDYINPDQEQLTDQDYLEFDDLFITPDLLMLNPDEAGRVDSTYVIRLGHDVDYDDDGKNSKLI